VIVAVAAQDVAVAVHSMNMKNLTPMMAQYFEIKNAYKDTILFFRLVDFY
jgi:hypothetical protein